MQKAKRVQALVFALALFQPIMDVMSYFASDTALSTLVTLLRMASLAVTVAAGFVCAEDKRPFYVSLGVLAVFSLSHFAVLSVYTVPSAADAVNLIRIYSFPINTISITALLLADDSTCDASLRALFGGVSSAFAVCICVMLISTLTGTDPHTYADKEVGTLGWFLNTNAQSAILSMAYPFALAAASKARSLRSAAVLAVSLVGAGALYFIATRLAYAAIFGVSAVFFAVAVLMKRRLAPSPRPVLFLVAPMLALALIQASPMTENRRLVADNAEDKAEISTAITSVGTSEDLYRHFLPVLCDRFGYDAVFTAYGGTADSAALTSMRREKLVYSHLLLAERPFCRAFGLDLPSMSAGGESFDAENDFHGIYFLCGSAGLTFLVGFILYALAPFVFDAIKHHSRVDFYCAAALSSAACGLAHAVFTAGVLRRPNSSFYLAAALAVMMYIHQKHKQYKDFSSI